MPTLMATEIFGPEEDPTVQVPLPQFVESGSSALYLALAKLTLTIGMHR